MMTLVAYLAHLVHNHIVLKTKSTGFGSPNVPRRTHRPMAVFFRPYAVAHLLWAGDGREGKSPAGSLGRRPSNPAICPPTPFGSGERVNPSKEAAMAMSTHVRASFPTTVTTAAHAARMWFIPRTPSMSLAAWRDHFRDLHLAGLRCDDWQERAERTAAWNIGFNNGVAQMIAGGARHG